jgi:peptide/nickel transport system ATP-binding protein
MGLQIVFVKKKKGCKNFMEMQTDSVETVKSIASDLKAAEPIVSVKNLTVTGKDGRLLVDHLSLQLKRGETLGLVGESGSGKTLTLKSLIGLLPKNLSESYEEKKINGNVAMIFQNPMSALDPLCPVFAQLIEVVMIRQNVSKKEAACRAKELIERLGLPKELSKKDRLPSELSGGQCQRILIAMALACKPDVLLCDEPTTALDVTVQKQTLDLILSLQKEMNFAILFVTHNLAVAAGICSHLAVMHHGKIVERAATKEILLTPKDEYTKMLLSAILRIPHK